jgi:hypothetical protein
MADLDPLNLLHQKIQLPYMKQRGLQTALRVINEERTYERTLPKKSLYKHLYAVEKRASAHNVNITIPYYWYLWGTVSPISVNDDSGVSATPDKVDEGLKEELRPVVSDVLDYYYENGLEGLTDYVYQDAPYDVQRAFRELDKKIRTHHDDYTDFFEVEPSRKSIIKSVYQVFDTFPTVKFPEHEQDVTKWYALFTSEVNEPEFDPDRLMQIDLLFWRIMSLSIAEEHHHGMSQAEVRDALGISSFKAERAVTRESLTELEDAILDDRYEEGDYPEFTTTENNLLDALAEPVLERDLQMSFSD